MRTKQNWPEVIEEFRQSGKSKVSFCKDSGVSYQSFLMHLKRSQEADSGGFQQILLNGSTGQDRIEFFWADGRCVSFPISTPKDIIRFLLSI